MPFERNLPRKKKASAKFTSLKHKNKIKVSSKLLIHADEERLGARNLPVVILWRSSPLTHPSREGSPTSQPIPEVMNRPGFKVVYTQNYRIYYQCLENLEPAAKHGCHPYTISGGIATQVESKPSRRALKPLNSPGQ